MMRQFSTTFYLAKFQAKICFNIKKLLYLLLPRRQLKKKDKFTKDKELGIENFFKEQK